MGEPMTLLALRTGRLGVDLAPAAGGSVARFICDDIDILRPMTADAIASGKGNDAALYPLVPYSNRIRDGRLLFEGEQFQLARNWPGIGHPMHGDGWAHRWDVVKSDAASAEITYQHERMAERGGWPFRYRARQHYHLDQASLSIRISLENLEDRPVPAGIGLHPFYARDPDGTLTCRTRFVWCADAEVLPVERIAVPAAWDFTAGRRPDSIALDNCFDGWDGRATIAWPSRRLRLDVEASTPFRHLVIYTPPRHSFFCAEPVSHANGQVGLAVLGPGSTLAGTVVFRLSTL
jgi:aldose 1-epimerase